MKKIDWNFTTSAIGSTSGTLYLDDNATAKQIQNAIYEEVGFYCYWNEESGYEPIEKTITEYEKRY